MNGQLSTALCLLVLLASLPLAAGPHYVSASSTGGVPPYTSWDTAASNIQDAVAEAIDDDIVLVTNGVYDRGAGAAPGQVLSNRVALTNHVAVYSVNGPADTMIEGDQVLPLRCAYLASGAELHGFTLEYGCTMTTSTWVYEGMGGGAFLDGGGMLSNCVIQWCEGVGGGGVALEGGGSIIDCTIVGNTGYGDGGGVVCDGGGEVIRSTITGNSGEHFDGGVAMVYGGLLDRCIITSNTAETLDYGGVNCIGGLVRNCLIADNVTSYESEFSDAGGLNLVEGGTAEWCVVRNNSCREKGGGVLVDDGGVLNNSYISGNRSRKGGGVFIGEDGQVNNCAVFDNHANQGGGAFSVGGTAVNCTFSGNTADWQGGGVFNSVTGLVRNCIVYHNTAPEGPNVVNDTASGFWYCCTAPVQPGVNNTTNDPLLAGIHNPHLLSNSPCMAAGNTAFAPGQLDIDGEPRTNGVSVDIGCDEFFAAGITGSLDVAIVADSSTAVVNFPVHFLADVEGKAERIDWQIDGQPGVTDSVAVSCTWPATGDYRVILTACNLEYPAGVAATATVHIVDRYTNYAALTSVPVPPFTSWATAAATIQDAVDACPAGGIVMVSNGVYAAGGTVSGAMSNRVTVATPITVISLNGPAATVIAGCGPGGSPEATRCVGLSGGAVLNGFTLSNGFTANSGDVANDMSGGGALMGDATMTNCIIAENWAYAWGGGMYCGSRAVVDRCVIRGNGAGSGGGVYCASASEVNRSAFEDNEAYQGGGLYCYLGSVVEQCTVFSNTAIVGGMMTGLGAGVYALGGTEIANSLIAQNDADVWGGGVYCAFESGAGEGRLDNCTISANQAGSQGGGVCCEMEPFPGSGLAWRLGNCIVYQNTAPVDPEHWISGIGQPFEYSCTVPSPGGTHNITNNPLFAGNADFHLLEGSPCIDRGTNAFVVGAWDVEGNARIIGGRVDMGAYEFVPEPAAGVAAGVCCYLLIARRRKE